MICPNCGKSVTSEQELCPHCGNPTQFSGRMKYYPKSTPLDPPEKPTPAPAQQSVPAAAQRLAATPTQQKAAAPEPLPLSADDYKQILNRLENAADKKMVKRVQRTLICLIIGLGVLMLLAMALLHHSSLSQLKTNATSGEVLRLSTKIDKLENTFRAMKEELETSMSSKSTEIMDSIESNKTGEKVLVTLYCSDATDALSYPVCFPIEMGSEYLLPELYGKDRDFLGWTKEKDADEKAEILKPGELITVDGSVSLYAKWNMVPTPTATPTPTPSPVPTPEEPSASSEEESDDVDVSESTPMPASVPTP